MVRAIERGITILDFNELTVGMIIGYIATYNHINEKNDETEVIDATQEDYDAF